jgi:deuterolysin
MFTKIFVSAIVATLVAANPVRRAEGLTVSIEAPDQISSLDDLQLTAKVVNTGADEVRVLKFNTVLESDIPTRSFHVNKDGAAVNFTGIAVSFLSFLVYPPWLSHRGRQTIF